MAGKKTKTSKKAATGTKKKQGKRGENSNKVFSYLAANPNKSLYEIAEAIDVTYAQVYNSISTPAGKILVEELEKQTAIAVQRIRAKALAYFEKFLDTPQKPEVELSALKFAIGNRLSKEEEAVPDELIFETVISEIGVVEQTTRKIYSKTTHKKKPEGEEGGEDDTPMP